MEVNIRNEFGWNLYEDSGIQLWFSGYLTGEKTLEFIISDLVSLSNDVCINIEKLSRWVGGLSGHFALVVKLSDNSCFLAVDKICSIPIFDVVKEDRYAVSNYAPYLKKMFDMDNDNINLQSLLEVAMSGFVIGDRTIYHGMNRLMAGECVFWDGLERHSDYYYTYFPFKNSLYDYTKLKSEFERVCLTTVKKLIDSVNERQIVVPLSAGNDSRLIVSCLKKLSYKNVICFTYGRYGNYEVNISEKVSNILGYKWVYIQDTLREKRAFFKSNTYKEYVKAFESYASVPNIQDIYEVHTLKSKNIIENDAIIVNGNSGDFISGGHIPLTLKLDEKFVLDDNAIWKQFLDKHYSLWSTIRTKLNDKVVISELSKIIVERHGYKKESKFYLYSILESIEYMGRQSRLVANQQRAYDFSGLEWRLPLWSEDFLDFWEKVPPQYKIDQRLYKDVLMENNWGGVWKGVDVNNKTIRPYGLYVVRIILKILAAPFGRSIWHRVEKNVLVYFMHPSYARTITSYLSILFDTYGHRDTNSWTANQFVKKNGFSSVTSVSNKIKNIFV